MRTLLLENNLAEAQDLKRLEKELKKQVCHQLKSRRVCHMEWLLS